MPEPLGSQGWTAIHDHMPGTHQTLRVDGVVVTPTPGYSAEIEAAVPQGINPRILEMNLRLTAPSSEQPQVLTSTPVHYEEATEFEYYQVNVREFGVLINVEHVF